MNCFHFGNSWGNNMIVKELKDLKKDIDDDAEIFIEKRNKTNNNFKLTNEDIKEIRDIIYQRGKYKKNKNTEPDYIYYEDLEPQMEPVSNFV